MFYPPFPADYAQRLQPPVFGPDENKLPANMVPARIQLAMAHMKNCLDFSEPRYFHTGTEWDAGEVQEFYPELPYKAQQLNHVCAIALAEYFLGSVGQEIMQDCEGCGGCDEAAECEVCGEVVAD